MKKIVIQARIDQETKDKFDKIAELKGMTESSLFRQLIKEFIKENAREN